jgi:hypothetical protein
MPGATHFPITVGFLTVVHEADGYLGGYLVTNQWSRPLEFRLTNTVQPNRVQQILYGTTLQSYVYADLIGRALVEKAASPVQCLFTDREAVLDLRLQLQVPVVWLAGPGDPLAEDLAEDEARVFACDDGETQLLCHPRYPEDQAVVRGLLDRAGRALDLKEPFVRIRDALLEARRIGVARC